MEVDLPKVKKEAGTESSDSKMSDKTVSKDTQNRGKKRKVTCAKNELG
jgi:hypothetical protein